MGSQISSATSMTRSGPVWAGPRGADLTGADADRVVQPTIGVAVGLVEYCPDDRAAFRRVGTAESVPFHHDDGAVVGFDDGPEVRAEGASRALFPGEVRAAEPAGHPSFAASLSDEEHLLPAALQADSPALGIGKADVEPSSAEQPILHVYTQLSARDNARIWRWARV